MEQIFVTFLVVFALFFANSTTVLVALVAKPLVLPTQWSHLQKIVHKPLESDLNFSKTLLQCSNVTVSCVKYHFSYKIFLILAFFWQALKCSFFVFWHFWQYILRLLHNVQCIQTKIKKGNHHMGASFFEIY